MFLLVPIGYRIDVMQTWSQQHVEIATFFSIHPQTFIKNNGSFRNWLATLVLDKPMDSFMNLKQSISNTSCSDPKAWHICNENRT